ncbi:hypothetical protein E2562_013018 [Oryza meyeriana var. granulata]|uniref:Uncharacterized protein n=1 Tax=Oryza meyeriana var. granulata TaxID=110450 RepID=A0A6G1DK59_9ORYZ|nr:hypothetical protein E2562_013018 [Oryza meyeriana var. granulata]
MEQEKNMVLNGMLPVNKEKKVIVMTRLMKAITDIENEARDHYGDRANMMRRREFVQMLLRDGCYILGKFVLPDCCPGISVGAGSHSGEVVMTKSTGTAGA